MSSKFKDETFAPPYSIDLQTLSQTTNPRPHDRHSSNRRRFLQGIGHTQLVLTYSSSFVRGSSNVFVFELITSSVKTRKLENETESSRTQNSPSRQQRERTKDKETISGNEINYKAKLSFSIFFIIGLFLTL